MANYRFNIPASGCTNKVIGSYPASDSGKIANFRFDEGIWNDVSISSAETGNIIEIYLNVDEYTETTSGRSIEEIDLFYDIVDVDDPSSILETCSVSVELCQLNKHVLPDSPQPPLDKMLTLITTRGDLYADCDEGGKVSINDSTITALTEDKTSIRSATINGDCVEKITYYTFSGCSNLTSVTLTEGIKAVGGFGSTRSNSTAACTSLTGITIPDSVTHIGGLTYGGSFAFSRCTSLTHCTFGENSQLEYIDDNSFCDCANLTNFDLPSGVTFIGAPQFEHCTSLTSITVNSNNSKYDSRNNCNAIIETNTNKLVLGCKNTVIPNEITSIGKSAFSVCEGLTSVDIPSGVTSIGEYAFYYCSGLTSIDIPTGVTSIGGNAFSNCNKLTRITIPNGVTSIEEGLLQNCTGLTSITIGNNVTSIGDNAFTQCNNITSFTIPSGVTSIGVEAFRSDSKLVTMTIPNNAETLGNYCFSYCTGLTSVSIGSSIRTIGKEAFSHCTALTSVTCNATTPPTLGTNVFSYTNDCPIYVPSGSVNTYKTKDGWSNYASRIQAI